MNRFSAVIEAVESSAHVSWIRLRAGGHRLSALVLETPDRAPYLREGETVTVLIKETEVALARDLSGAISLRNRLDGTVTAVERGAVLARVAIDSGGLKLTSVITARSAGELALAPGVAVTALIKSNEVSLAPTDASGERR